MPISKHRPNKKKKSRKQHARLKETPSDLKAPVFFEHPFNRVPREELLKALKELGAKATEDFPKHLSSAQKFVRLYDPSLVLSTLSFYGIFQGLTEDMSIKSSVIRQDQIELLQAFYLQVPAPELGTNLHSPNDIQSIIEDMTALTDTYVFSGLAEEKATGNDEVDSEKQLLRLMRQHTQVVRNWAFFNQAIDITKRLFNRIDDDFEKAVGLPASALIDVFSGILKKIEERGSERFKLMQKIFSKRTVKEVIQEYYQCFPQLDGSPDSVIDSLRENKINATSAKFFVMSHLELGLPKLFTVSAIEFANEYELDSDKLSLVFDKLSFSFGELENSKTEHLFLANPIWLKPFIKLDPDKYLCVVPSLFTGYIFRILESLFEHDTKLLTRYQDRVRGDFLEDEIAQLFKNAFPGCESHVGYKWGQFESDLLVRVDNNLFIVEAKSHKANPIALRGGKNKAKKHVEDVFLHPSEQSLRLQNSLKIVLDEPERADELLPKFPFELKKINNIHRLSVTLEDFAVLQSNLRLCQDAGWISKDHPIAPCMLVTDLAIIFDMLELSALKIHYLKRRAQISNEISYLGDELDLLGLYMKCGFNFSKDAAGHSLVTISGMSSLIDHYYCAKDVGEVAHKPRPRLHPYWVDLCKTLEKRDFDGWSSAAMAVLNFSLEEQEQGWKNLKAMKLSVKNRWKDPKHLCSIVMIPNKEKHEALVLHAFNSENKDRRHEIMQELASSALEHDHIDTCVVISTNIDSDNYPYSTMALFNRHERLH